MARDSGQIHEASKWFKQALEVDGDNPDIVAYMGNLHMRNSEWGPAQKKFEKILEMVRFECPTPCSAFVAVIVHYSNRPEQFMLVVPRPFEGFLFRKGGLPIMCSPNKIDPVSFCFHHDYMTSAWASRRQLRESLVGKRVLQQPRRSYQVRKAPASCRELLPRGPEKRRCQRLFRYGAMLPRPSALCCSDQSIPTITVVTTAKIVLALTICTLQAVELILKRPLRSARVYLSCWVICFVPFVLDLSSERFGNGAGGERDPGSCKRRLRASPRSLCGGSGRCVDQFGSRVPSSEQAQRGELHWTYLVQREEKIRP